MNRTKQQCSALLYHHVGPRYPGTSPALTISQEDFEHQMQWLARWGYRGIKVSEWQGWSKHNRGQNEKPILLTFDDAYADITEFALPILARFGFSATIFVVTARIGQTSAWDETNGYTPLRLMTAEQIRYWTQRGMEFGAHSRTHADLTTLPGTELHKEIVGSRDDLSSLLGSPVSAFAYPYGAFNDPAYNLVSNNFTFAFTVEEGRNFTSADHHRLRRAFVGPSTSLLQFAVIVRWSGGMKWWRDLRVKLGIRTRLSAVKLLYRRR